MKHCCSWSQLFGKIPCLGWQVVCTTACGLVPRLLRWVRLSLRVAGTRLSEERPGARVYLDSGIGALPVAPGLPRGG